ILLFDASVLAYLSRSGWVRWVLGAPPAPTIVIFFAMYLWFEAWFYATHRLMHTRRLFFIHRHHHVSDVTHPRTSLSFSLSESVRYQVGIFLGFAALSRVAPVPAVSALAFFAVTYFLNVLIHSNFEVVPTWLVRSPLGKILGTASFHAMHHARGSRHYG